MSSGWLLPLTAWVLLAGCSAKAPLESGMPPPASREPVVEIPGYLTSPAGGPLKDAQGRCWRTADWRPALAIEACDPALARERRLRELALSLSGVASVPEPLATPVETRFEGAPPPAASTPAARDDDGVPAGTEQAAATVSNSGEPVAATATEAARAAALAALTGAAPAASGAGATTSAAGSVPGTPATAAAKPGHVIKPVVLNTDAAFFFGKDRLTVAGRDAVENLAAYIKLWGIEEVQVEVVGHTDRIGNARDNLALSKRRADAVRQVLIEAGVPADAITATGVGSTQPVTQPDACPDDIDRCERINCLAPDRRVEVGLKGTRKTPSR